MKKKLIPIIITMVSLATTVMAYTRKYSTRDKAEAGVDLSWGFLKELFIDYWYVWVVLMLIGWAIHKIKGGSGKGEVHIHQ